MAVSRADTGFQRRGSKYRLPKAFPSGGPVATSPEKSTLKSLEIRFLAF